MTSGALNADTNVLDAFESRWRKLGYALVRDPDPAQLPSFFEDERPDAIALGPSPSLAIEVLRPREAESNRRAARLRTLLEGRDDWKLELVVLMSNGPTFSPEKASALPAAFARAEWLSEHDPAAGLLMAWAALEAVGRSLEPSLSVNALAAGTLIDLLVSNGHLEQSDGSRLWPLAELRNRVAHGQLDAKPTKEDVEAIIAMGSRLSTLIG